MDRLVGKVALVFGADEITSGIATRFIAEGALVHVVDTAAALTGFAEGAQQFAAASRQPAAIGAAVRQAVGDGPLDIIVIGGGDLPPEQSWTSIDAVDPAALAADAGGEIAASLAAVQAAGPAIKRKGGAILFLANPAGNYSEGGWGDAPTIHNARRGLARTLAREWGEFQVRVNTMVPFARTGGFEAYRARNPQEVDWRVSKCAMQRAGDPVRDIGGAAVFMVSDDSRFLTGALVNADGGAFLSSPPVETCMEKVA